MDNGGVHVARKNNALQIPVGARLTHLTNSEISRLNRLIKKTQLENPNPRDIQALRTMLETHPQLWRVMGDLVHISIHAVLGLDNWLNQGTRLSVEIGIREIKKDLGYDQAPALEKMLIDQIVVTWLQVNKTRIKYEQVQSAGVSVQSALYWEDRLNGANARYLRAIDSLARHRKVSPPGAIQVNIGARQVNLATPSDNQIRADQSTDTSDTNTVSPNDLMPE